MASLKTWEHRFNANVQFIDRQFSEYYILSTFTYYAREALKQRPPSRRMSAELETFTPASRRSKEKQLTDEQRAEMAARLSKGPQDGV